MPAKQTKEEWIAKAEKVHGKGTYDYSEVIFTKATDKVKIKCNRCGNYFYQSFYKHVTMKRGCKNCNSKDAREKLRKTEKENWLKKVIEKWGDILDFSIAEKEYVNYDSTVTIICKKCGTIFRINAGHLSSDCTHPCPSCYKKFYFEKRAKSTEEFIKDAEKIHGKGEYDYSKVKYRGCDEPVLIIDPKRNNEEFWQKPSVHLQGKGNPRRSESHGEQYINKWLNSNKIKYSKQVKIFGISGRKSNYIIADFYLEFNDKKILIEFNGIQHYKIDKFYDVSRQHDLLNLTNNFNQQVNRDKHVKEYCKENNIIFVEIPYTYDTFNKISEVLNKIIIENLDPGDVLIIPEVEYTLTEQQKAKYGTIKNNKTDDYL